MVNVKKKKKKEKKKKKKEKIENRAFNMYAAVDFITFLSVANRSQKKIYYYYERNNLFANDAF